METQCQPRNDGDANARRARQAKEARHCRAAGLEIGSGGRRDAEGTTARHTSEHGTREHDAARECARALSSRRRRSSQSRSGRRNTCGLLPKGAGYLAEVQHFSDVATAAGRCSGTAGCRPRGPRVPGHSEASSGGSRGAAAPKATDAVAYANEAEWSSRGRSLSTARRANMRSRLGGVRDRACPM